jgi:hypothetical protein
MKIRCVDNTGKARHFLDVGKVYTIVSDWCGSYFLEGVEACWGDWRFVAVDESKNDTSYPHDEECKCGMLRRQCEYHM